MKVEKVSANVYRVRKTVGGKTFRVCFDHIPDDMEATIALAGVMKDEGYGKKGSFERLANEYIDNRSSVLSPSTIQTYKKNLRQVSDWFKTLNLYTIKSQDVQKEINDFAEGRAPKTVKVLNGFIMSVIGAYRPDTHFRIKLPQNVQKSRYDPTEEDIQRILEDVKGTDYSVPFQLAVLSCRRGEICAFTMDDLDGNDLHVHRTMVYDENNNWVIKECPKTDASNRTIRLPDSLVKEIQDQGYIYNNHPNALNKAIHRSQKRLGIPAFKFHSLRSYFVTYCHSKNIPDKYIMLMGGWASDYVMKNAYRKSFQDQTNDFMDQVAGDIINPTGKKTGK